MILAFQVIFAGICLIGIPAGIIQSIINERRIPHYMTDRKPGRREQRDSHGAAFFDGVVTMKALDELDDMFK